jgi:site-specific recombinase XerD
VGTATADPRPFFLSISRMITPVKQQLAAVRMLFDWLITGQIMPVNPASAVRGPKHVVKTGKTPVLEGQEWRKLIDAIPDRHGAGPTRPGADRHPHAAGIGADKKGFLFRTSRGHGGTALADQPMTQVDAWRMVRKRALAAGIMAPIGNHSFRATGITAYLANGGALEHAQAMAAHESPRTTKLYDRTKERLTQDEVERIRL